MGNITTVFQSATGASNLSGLGSERRNESAKIKNKSTKTISQKRWNQSTEKPYETWTVGFSGCKVGQH